MENKITKKVFEKDVEKIKEKEKKKKKKREKRKDPNIKEIREHLRKIVAYHKRMVNEGIPSVYPILGAVNSDSDTDDGDDEKEKRKHTKSELKRY